MSASSARVTRLRLTNSNVPGNRKIGSRDLAHVAARVLIRDGLTHATERMWERMAEPGDPRPADVMVALPIKHNVEPRALRCAGADYGGFTVKQLAQAVVDELAGAGKATTLEAENERLRARVAELEAALVLREVAE